MVQKNIAEADLAANQLPSFRSTVEIQSSVIKFIPSSVMLIEKNSLETPLRAVRQG